MPRRRKSNNLALALVQLLVVVIAIGLLLYRFETLVHVLLGLGSLVVVGFAAHNLRTFRRPREEEKQTNSTEIVAPTDVRDKFNREQGATEALSSQLRSIDWFQFEKLVAALFRQQGYTVTPKGGANADGGIDLILEKSEERIAVQCKHWKSWQLGLRHVREFLGALTDARLSKGIIVTLCGHTLAARELADRHGISLIHEARLAEMLQSAQVSFDPEVISLLNAEKKHCPQCESPMVLRTAIKGPQPGEQFWGCRRFPACRFTLRATSRSTQV
jgi:HJR/Mrr/RecB family endonuclease